MKKWNLKPNLGTCLVHSCRFDRVSGRDEGFGVQRHVPVELV